MAGLLGTTKSGFLGTTRRGGLLTGTTGNTIGGERTDLTTSEGLYNLAVQSGLQRQANKVLSNKAEETKKIFSGGFISDIFDALNALQYGVVGLLKGKGFLKGVETRQSWSDKDALGEFGIPGMIGGIALDIASDPLTYIAPWTIAKKVGILGKIKRVAKISEETKIGKFLGKRFIYRFGEDPIYKALDTRRIKNISTGQTSIQKLIEPIIKLPVKKGAALLTRTKTGSFIRTPLSNLKKVLSKDELWDLSKSYAILDDMGKQAVDVGLLSKGTWEKNLGEYIKNAYTEFELPKVKKGIWGYMKKGIRGIKKRKPLTLAKRAELGEIKNPAYLLSKSMMDLQVDVENAKLFKGVFQKGLTSETIKDGFSQLPKTNRLGFLSGKYVPQPIFDSIQEITRSRTAWDKSVGKLVAGFKFGKVVMNPATHGRNIISNMLLNWWKLGIGPWRVDRYAEGVKELATKGKWYKEALMGGMDESTYIAQEINNILLGPDAINVWGKGNKLWKQTARKLGDIYQGEEKIAKLTAFIAKRKAGLGIDDAWKAAESATFNYAQVTPFIRKLRTSLFGFPFITFTYKATPVAIETALKHPQRISALGKIKTAIENQSDVHLTARERASEPSWVKEGLYIKLPIKDKYGRSSYFDLTYIMPFGDLVSGDFIERQISRETGVKEGVVPAIARKSPFFNFIKEVTSNQDFYGNKIWKDGDSTAQQLGDLFRHLSKTYLPPLLADQLPGGYITKGKKVGQRRPTVLARTKEARETQYRTLTQEMLRNVGLKVQPINVDIQETYMEWEKKKALETLLSEAGVLQQFQRYYVPK